MLPTAALSLLAPTGLDWRERVHDETLGSVFIDGEAHLHVRSTAHRTRVTPLIDRDTQRRHRTGRWLEKPRDGYDVEQGRRDLAPAVEQAPLVVKERQRVRGR